MATLKYWYPLTQDYKDYSGNNNDLVQYGDTGALVMKPGLLGMSVVQEEIAKTVRLENSANRLTGSHAMFCFLRVDTLASLQSVNGVLGCHNSSRNTGTGITLSAITSSTFNLSVNTGHGDSRTYKTYKTNAVLEIGEWYHVGFTFNEDLNTIDFFINGAHDSTHVMAKSLVSRPSDSFCLFIWSVAYSNNSSYRPAMAIQDVRVWQGVPDKHLIKEVSKGLFFHAPLDSPNKVLSFPVNAWTCNATHASVIESGKEQVKLLIKTDGQLHVKADTDLTVGRRYRLSAYCLRNELPVEVSVGINYTGTDYEFFSEPDTGWFTFEFVATSEWVLDGSLNLGPLLTNDVYTFLDISVEDLDSESTATAKVTDASGLGHGMVIDKRHPLFSPNAAFYGKGSAYFKHNIIASEQRLYRNANTISGHCFIKTTSIGHEGWHSPISYGYSKTEILIYETKVRFRLAITGNVLFDFDVNVLDGNWHQLAFAYDGNTFRGYHNGKMVIETVVNKSLDSNDSRVILGKREIYINSIYGAKDLFLSDVRLYGTALSSNEIKKLYTAKVIKTKHGAIDCNNFDDTKPGTSISKTGVFKSSDLIEHTYKPSVVDYSEWVIGESFSETFRPNGPSDHSLIKAGTCPHGIEDVLWESTNVDVESDADGGFNSLYFPIDHYYSYRFSVWVNRKVLGNGKLYFGFRAYNDSTSVSTIDFNYKIEGNPYFAELGSSNLPEDEWLLYIGVVHPSNVREPSVMGQGIYNTKGERVGDVNEYRFTNEATRALIRSYLYYSTDLTTVQQWYRPRVDKLDGSEPSLSELVACSENVPLLKFYKDNVYSGPSLDIKSTLEVSDLRELK